jgi:hypothetical protein
VTEPNTPGVLDEKSPRSFCKLEQGLGDAMSIPVATTIIDSMQVLDQNLRVAANFQAEMQRLRDQCRVAAADGHLKLFKMTTKYDGKVRTRRASFPNRQQLPL